MHDTRVHLASKQTASACGTQGILGCQCLPCTDRQVKHNRDRLARNSHHLLPSLRM
jgi:hypothetical protein